VLDQFSATIEKIYAAAGDQQLWPSALAAIEELTESAGAVVHLVPKRAPPTPVTLLGTSAQGYFLPEQLAEWTRNYAPHCPRLAAANKMPGAPYIADYMLLTEREMDLNPVYDWYGSYGLRYFIGSELYETDDLQIVWSLQRRRDQGHVQSQEVELFESVKPHLARAFVLADQLGTLRSFNVFSSALLEALPQAVFALDTDRNLLFANTRGQDLLAAADGVAVDEGRLVACASTEQTRFDSMIRSATEPAGGLKSGWARISRPSGRPAYAVFVAPLNCADEELVAAQAKVLVMAYDTGERRPANVQMLTGLYGLTDAEARLASALSAGHSLESAAALLGVQPATVRSELKSVFRKVGVNRQQDLVRVLTSLSSIGNP
jgi:DNA-binding CsgD family transcriptional regulator